MRNGFRGSIAPASLKPVLPLPHGAHRIGFRGSIAPASLKRLDDDPSMQMTLGFRGSIAPASLKHFVFPLTERIFSVVSGALLPRPH